MSARAKIQTIIILTILLLAALFVLSNFIKLQKFQLFFLLSDLLVLLVLILLYHFYHFNIFKPLNAITRTLNSDSPEKLIRIGLRRDEFGKIARFIMEFFHQRNLLRDRLVELNKAYDKMELLNSDLKQLANSLTQANEEIRLQKNEIELQHTEISESISYAGIVQAAALNVPKSLALVFPEHFIFFKPRNVLSGDFYWVCEKNDVFYIAGADCTGHSLAGAMLSMMGISLLNNILLEKEYSLPSEILNRLRAEIIEALHQKGEFGEAHGGMDMVMCTINKNTDTLNYAGAYNPLIIVRNIDGQNQLIELKADSMPVGLHLRIEPFKNNTLSLCSGDMLYIMTDGLADQFGGINNKKFNAKRLKEKLLNIANLNAEKQINEIETTFINWKGENEQTDDVLIIGIRY